MAASFLFCRITQKPSPWGGRWRGTRRMRGKLPAVAPSSVTCGDSFPQRGKPFGRFTRNVHVADLSRAGHTPPLLRNIFLSPRRAGGPHPAVKAIPWGGRWRGTRRMRGKLPAAAPSSVTCGDSFPQGGSLSGDLSIILLQPQNHPRQLGCRGWFFQKNQLSPYPQTLPSPFSPAPWCRRGAQSTSSQSSAPQRSQRRGTARGSQWRASGCPPQWG